MGSQEMGYHSLVDQRDSVSCGHVGYHFSRNVPSVGYVILLDVDNVCADMAYPHQQIRSVNFASRKQFISDSELYFGF